MKLFAYFLTATWLSILRSLLTLLSGDVLTKGPDKQLSYMDS